MKRLNLAQGVLWLALLLALVGSLRHVAWAFATLEGGDLIAGYVQAVAVDIGLFSLAYGIQQRRREHRSTLVLWAGVLLFSLISTYANLLHGLHFASDLGLSTWGLARPFLLSGVLPVLVVYLSEIVSSDVQHAAQQAERERKRASRQVSVSEQTDSFPMPVEQARAIGAEQKAQSKAEVLDAMLDIWRGQPDIGVSEVAKQVGRSRTTVYEYRSELEQAGRIRQDGKGVEVLPD